ncbi:MAG: phage holin family protein, partial [Pseudomonadota bacterium]|nr:phage holin family protein [Pseudomonadota bacterium]
MSSPTTPFAEPVEPHVVRSTGPVPAGAGGDNVVDLVRQLAGQGSHLAEQQLSLIKAEIRESATEVKAAVGAMAGAAVVGIAGLGVVLMGLAYLLADAI